MACNSLAVAEAMVVAWTTETQQKTTESQIEH